MQITTIKSTDDKYFAEVWNIYNYSFPAHEKRTLENQKRSLEEFDNCFIDVFLDDKEVVGFMIYWNFDTFTYLEHFAINSSRRNGGNGSKLLTAFIERHKPRTVILDIDPPTDEISIRRRGFYDRLGFELNPYKHILPPYNNPCNSEFELLLMSHGRILSPEEFNIFKKALYEKIMG